MNTMEKTADFAGRVLLATMFLIAGLPKIGAYTGTQAFMASAGVPGALLPAVIAIEVLGAVALIVGYRTRLAALLLAGFTVLAALLFHRAPEQMQQIMFLKNLAIAGGLLILVARGAGPWSLDSRNTALAAPGALGRST